LARIVWIIIMLAILLAPAHSQYLGRMLTDDVFPMQGGSLVWLAEGPVTGGDMADLAIADLNGDGQEDLLVGSGYGDLLYYRRLAGDIFAAPQPLIADSTDSASWPPKPRQVSPALVDWNDDGQLELLLGWEGQLLWYELRGVALRGGQAMRLADGTKIADAIRQVAPEVGHLAPAVGDVGGDGDHDLLLGGDDGSVWWLERAAHEAGSRWQPLRRLRAGGSPVEVGSRARPCVLDWEGDGHKDVLIGQGDGELWLVRGSSDGLEAAERISVRGQSGLTALAPQLAGPGEIWLGSADGLVLKARPSSGALEYSGKLLARPAPLDVGQAAAVSALDWNGDDRLDLLVGNRRGDVHVFEQIGVGEKLMMASAKAVSATPGIVCAADGYAWPRCADADGDGDLDMFVGTGAGLVELWINSGSFVRRGPVEVAGQTIRTVGAALVAPCDYDRDGDVDLFVGSKPTSTLSGEATLPAHRVAYFENKAGHRRSLPVFNKGTLIVMQIAGSSEQAALDSAVLGPQLAEPLATVARGTTDFLLTADLGVFLFSTSQSRGAYPFLEIGSWPGRLPPALAPPVYSAYACDFLGTGRPVLLCGLEQYGMIVACPSCLP